MNKRELSERDICTKCITPAIERAGWDLTTQVREEFPLTSGRIIVRGKMHTRAKNKRADYVLFYKPNIPIAVIEAKDNNHTIADGMQQALGYAELLQVPFVLSSNGDGFLFHNRISADGVLEREISLDEFPSPVKDTGQTIDVPTNIRHDNTLSRPLKDYGPKDRVDIVITNPPFGGIENNFPKKYQTRETADLFMALIMHLLRHDTGRAAVVLPDGFLFGEGAKTTLKKELLDEFNLHTIVRLPKGVFSPYTGINTNILFFEKGGPTKQVWFFEDPYPEGYKSYSRSKPLTIQEFEAEKRWWNKRKETEHAWKVSVKEIEARNYNLDFKNPHVNKLSSDLIKYIEQEQLLSIINLTPDNKLILHLLGECTD